MKTVKIGFIKLNWALNTGAIPVQLIDFEGREFTNEFLFPLGEKKADNSYNLDALQLTSLQLKAVEATKLLMGAVLGDNVTAPIVADIKIATPEEVAETVEKAKEETKPKATRTKKAEKEAEKEDVVEFYSKANPKCKSACSVMIKESTGMDTKDIPDGAKLALSLIEHMTHNQVPFFRNGEITAEVKALFKEKCEQHLNDVADF